MKIITKSTSTPELVQKDTFVQPHHKQSLSSTFTNFLFFPLATFPDTPSIQFAKKSEHVSAFAYSL